MSPAGIDENGILEMLKEYSLDIENIFRIRCDLKIDGEILINDDIISLNIFRIVQEAVTNAVKHGKADVIKISLVKKDDGLELMISDNGKGIDLSQTENKGMGLRTMKYRANMMNAALEIGSGKEGGTVISCIIHSMEKNR